MRIQVRQAARLRPRIELLPMIDVTFFLLIFFMLFTTFKTVETGLEVDLPRAATGTDQVSVNMVVTITKSGAIYLDDRLVTLDVFRQEARRVAEQNPQAVVTIRGDSQSYWEHAVSVMDTARQAGLTHFAFGTQPTS